MRMIFIPFTKPWLVHTYGQEIFLPILPRWSTWSAGGSSEPSAGLGLLGKRVVEQGWGELTGFRGWCGCLGCHCRHSQSCFLDFMAFCSLITDSPEICRAGWLKALGHVKGNKNRTECQHAGQMAGSLALSGCCRQEMIWSTQPFLVVWLREGRRAKAGTAVAVFQSWFPSSLQCYCFCFPYQENKQTQNQQKLLDISSCSDSLSSFPATFKAVGQYQKYPERIVWKLRSPLSLVLMDSQVVLPPHCYPGWPAEKLAWVVKMQTHALHQRWQTLGFLHFPFPASSLPAFLLQ